jgi:hypothetical protein
MGDESGVDRFLVGRPEGKRTLGKPRRRWEDNIKIDLREVGIDVANWIHLAQDRVQWWACVEHGVEPSGSIRKDIFDRLSDKQLFKNILRHGVSK